MKSIYLDYNATTPIDQRVAEAMRPFLVDFFGNPSSIHAEGLKAKDAVEKARRQIAEMINCHADEIIFTSGGTESNNYAIKGVALASRKRGNHIITSSTEHPSVTEVCHYLEKEGFSITYLPVDEHGLIASADVENSILPSTILITIMHANNETGTIQPIEEIGQVAEKYGIPFHSDAAQSAGKIEVDVNKLHVGLLSLAGHKLYAPKGVGALYIRRGIQLEKLIHGANHEQNLRAGTENVMSVAGLGRACQLITELNHAEVTGMKDLRDEMLNKLRSEIPEIKLNGHTEKRLPNTLNISFPGVEAALLLEKMSPVAASAGAACHSGSEVISPVLSAMQVADYFAMGSIRFSLGRMTTADEVDVAVKLIVKAYHELSGISESSVIFPSNSDIKLTHFTHGMGCACKIRPQYLEKILKGLPVSTDPNILVGLQDPDDAAVFRVSKETTLVQTVDFFTPVVDDPYEFGAIAAANALSDIYAMGGTPLFALSIVGFPEKLLPPEALMQILRGASDKAAEAGISIIGGHTVEDTEPKFGLVVTGTIDREKILTHSAAQPGDVIILTKSLGTGILSTGIKRGLVDKKTERLLVATMSELNDKAARIMTHFPVTACTDVTGFGLLGHLKEMILGSQAGAVIRYKDVPVLPGTWEMAAMDLIPGGTRNNLQFVEDVVVWEEKVPFLARLILSDAQTSGGLLITLPECHAAQFLSQCQKAGIKAAAVIGHIKEGRKVDVQ